MIEARKIDVYIVFVWLNRSRWFTALVSVCSFKVLLKERALVTCQVARFLLARTRRPLSSRKRSPRKRINCLIHITNIKFFIRHLPSIVKTIIRNYFAIMLNPINTFIVTRDFLFTSIEFYRNMDNITYCYIAYIITITRKWYHAIY